MSSAADLGKGARDPPPPLFLEQTEAQRAEKIFLEARPLPYLRVWTNAPQTPNTPHSPPLPQSPGVDRALVLAQTFQLSQFEQSIHGLMI